MIWLITLKNHEPNEVKSNVLTYTHSIALYGAMLTVGAQ